MLPNILGAVLLQHNSELIINEDFEHYPCQLVLTSAYIYAVSPEGQEQSTTIRRIQVTDITELVVGSRPDELGFKIPTSFDMLLSVGKGRDNHVIPTFQRNVSLKLRKVGIPLSQGLRLAPPEMFLSKDTLQKLSKESKPQLTTDQLRSHILQTHQDSVIGTVCIEVLKATGLRGSTQHHNLSTVVCCTVEENEQQTTRPYGWITDTFDPVWIPLEQDQYSTTVPDNTVDTVEPEQDCSDSDSEFISARQARSKSVIQQFFNGRNTPSPLPLMQYSSHAASSSNEEESRSPAAPLLFPVTVSRCLLTFDVWLIDAFSHTTTKSATELTGEPERLGTVTWHTNLFTLSNTPLVQKLVLQPSNVTLAVTQTISFNCNRPNCILPGNLFIRVAFSPSTTTSPFPTITENNKEEVQNEATADPKQKISPSKLFRKALLGARFLGAATSNSNKPPCSGTFVVEVISGQHIHILNESSTVTKLTKTKGAAQQQHQLFVSVASPVSDQTYYTHAIDNTNNPTWNCSFCFEHLSPPCFALLMVWSGLPSTEKNPHPESHFCGQAYVEMLSQKATLEVDEANGGQQCMKMKAREILLQPRYNKQFQDDDMDILCSKGIPASITVGTSFYIEHPDDQKKLERNCPGTLRLTVIKASKLISNQNIYVQFTIGRVRCTTEAMKGSFSPEWNQDFQVDETGLNRIEFTVWEQTGKHQQDNCLGASFLDITQRTVDYEHSLPLHPRKGHIEESIEWSKRRSFGTLHVLLHFDPINVQNVNDVLPIGFPLINSTTSDKVEHAASKLRRGEIPIMPIPTRFKDVTGFLPLIGKVIHYFNPVLRTNYRGKDLEEICVITPKTIYLCHMDGTVNKHVQFQHFTKLTIDEKQQAVGMICQEGEQDLLIISPDFVSIASIVKLMYKAKTQTRLMVVKHEGKKKLKDTLNLKKTVEFRKTLQEGQFFGQDWD